MSTLSILPLTTDMDYVLDRLRLAGVVNHYGYSEAPDGFELRYRAQDFDAVQAVLDAYQVDYANDVLRARMLTETTETRWAKQQLPATFMGMPVMTDDVTIGRITAAAFLMGADPESPQTRRWKVGPDLWVGFDRATLVAMGSAIANHMQGCFEREEALHDAIKTAPTVADLQAIDLQAGWPDDATAPL